MATIGNTSLTLADWAKRQDPDQKQARMIEMLTQTNEVLTDMLWMEGNLPTGHRTTIRTGLPTGTYRALNAGIPRGKSTSAQVDETCAMLENLGVVDVALAELNGNTAAFRLSENSAFMEGMNQDMATGLFYNNDALAPAQFLGLSPRYSDSTAKNGQNIIKMGGSGSDNTSIWLVLWGDQTVAGIYPKGSKAGLEHNDMGIELVDDGTGKVFRAYRDHYKWNCGIALRDWRYAVRICNVDVSDLIADTDGTTVKLIENMIRAVHRIPNLKMGRAAFYMNRTIRECLDIQAMNKKNVQLRIDEYDGEFRTSLRGVPFRTVDALLNTEAPVV
ncbi:hypothetical protein HUW52_27345 [Pseudomonas sp. 43A]|uniref:major capsid protein n=1 Tax=unclassified Pseudomonas TaxID=196821 RepID=UPI0015874075|nr:MULTISPECIES: hypothetical protein [unclassified Pseudomonas]QKV66473.1 hypothetical protein HUW52_27345 [Pseudomonas sp. 43A]QMW11074.1 hypothetical protein H3303_05360 [Pseudomonas sp. 29A]